MQDQMKLMKWALFLTCLFLSTLATPLVWLGIFAFSPYHTQSSQNIYLDVRKGQNPNDITKTLASQGIISNARSFIWLGRITRQWKNIKAGEYSLSGNMTPIEVFSTLTSGISASHPVTVREGENIYEIADDLMSKGLVTRNQFLALCKNKQFIGSLGLFGNQPPPSLEGYLYPDTYFFNRTMTSTDMVRHMTRHFFDFWGKPQEVLANHIRMTRHQVITLASIIEKETGVAQERPIISSVFHNRLRIKMRLQSDPTTIYGMWERYDGNITRADLFEKNAYNTYQTKALPIGPIANPGKESIEAALHPSTSPYLYFVSHNDGTHEFSKTLKEHNRAVARFQLDPKAKEGKSWRDQLKKKH